MTVQKGVSFLNYSRPEAMTAYIKIIEAPDKKRSEVAILCLNT